jgi:hypothetical protein
LLRHGVAAALLVSVAVAAQAQTPQSLAVDTKYSLAWWQVSPHLNHLWATTCPEEPSWRPGEGRSGGWQIDPELKTESKTGYQNVADTIHVPLYPRRTVETRCTESVSGHIDIADIDNWRGISGVVAVRGEALVSGEDRRDAYARKSILHTTRYPEMKFHIDSVVNVTRNADTLSGTAVGSFELHGVIKPARAEVQSWPDARGRRALAKFRIPAQAMAEDFGLSRFALGLGMGTKIWQHLYMGVDVILRPAPAGNPAE